MREVLWNEAGKKSFSVKRDVRTPVRATLAACSSVDSAGVAGPQPCQGGDQIEEIEAWAGKQDSYIRR